MIIDDLALWACRPGQGTGGTQASAPGQGGATRPPQGTTAIERLRAQLEEQDLAVEFRAAIAIIRPDAISFSAGFPLTPEAFLLAVIVSRLQGAGLEEEEPPPAPLVQPTQMS